MAAPAKTLEIRTSPHLLSGYAVDSIMFNVVVALAPAVVFAIYAFGWAAVAVLGTATATCVATEASICRRAPAGKSSTLGDWSAVVTGLLYGLTLPASLPLWMVVVGGLVSMVVGKLLFGGLGQNPFNPALVGRAVMQATFPVAMTTWLPPFAAGRFAGLPGSLLTLPFTQPVYDAATQATPLALWKFGRQATGAADLALGFVGGSTGETSAVLLLLGGAYLVARNMMSWRTPVAIFASVAAVSGALHLARPRALRRPRLPPLRGRTGARRGLHGHRHGDLADHARRRLGLRRADRRAGGRHPGLGRHARRA